VRTPFRHRHGVARAVAVLGLAGAVGGAAITACSARAVVRAEGAHADAPGAPATARLATAPDQFFVSGDARLRYREAGTGEAVVLLHGMTLSLDDWAANGVGDSLARGHRVIALDERGHGRSAAFTDPARYGAAMADDVVRLLDHLRVRRAHLVGHSMGGLVATSVAARYPERVASAALLAPPIYADSAAFARATGPWIADLEGGAGWVRFFRWLVPAMPAAEAERVSAALLAATAPAQSVAIWRSLGALTPPAERIAASRVPVLVAVGTSDPLLENGRALAARWPGARLLEVPGADHGGVIARPEVLAALRAMMRQTGAPGAR
jgi:pimeloyl-ACP methyl ester carboxylesterase